MKMITVMVNDIFNLFNETVSKLLIKSIQINQANTHNLCEDFALLILKVLLKNNIVSQELFIDTKKG